MITTVQTPSPARPAFLESMFSCRGCGSEQTAPVVDLGVVPASDLFPPAESTEEDPRWPLRVFFCSACGLAQLGPDSHPEPEAPRAVESATALEHARRSAADIVEREGLHPGATVIEIDSHHGGSWLGGFQAAGLLARPADATADLVADVHGLAHEMDLHPPLAAHAQRLAPGGRLVLEFHHLLPLVEQTQVDTIRHGHWVYLSLTCMQRLLAEHGLVVTRAVEVAVFGGSLRMTAQHAADHPAIDPSVADVLEREASAGIDRVSGLAAFGDRSKGVGAAFRAHLVACRADGRQVAGYGAPSKAPVLAALAGVDADLLPYTVDLAPAKAGRRLPGTRIPIFSPDELVARRPDEVVIFTWDIAEEIARQLGAAAAGTGWAPSLYVPLPEPRYVEMANG